MTSTTVVLVEVGTDEMTDGGAMEPSPLSGRPAGKELDGPVVREGLNDRRVRTVICCVVDCGREEKMDRPV